MKAEFFKAVCPLEIGDTVAIRLAEKGGETREAYYLPQGCVAITPGAVALRKVTDIATLHYLKKGEIIWQNLITDALGRTGFHSWCRTRTRQTVKLIPINII